MKDNEQYLKTQIVIVSRYLAHVDAMMDMVVVYLEKNPDADINGVIGILKSVGIATKGVKDVLDEVCQ